MENVAQRLFVLQMKTVFSPLLAVMDNIAYQFLNVEDLVIVEEEWDATKENVGTFAEVDGVMNPFTVTMVLV